MNSGGRKVVWFPYRHNMAVRSFPTELLHTVFRSFPVDALPKCEASGGMNENTTRLIISTWEPKKMTDILQTTFWNMHENCCTFIELSLKYVPISDSINNVSALLHIMTWHRKGDKPLSEAMMTQFNYTYIYIYIYASLGLYELRHFKTHRTRIDRSKGIVHNAFVELAKRWENSTKN